MGKQTALAKEVYYWELRETSPRPPSLFNEFGKWHVLPSTYHLIDVSPRFYRNNRCFEHRFTSLLALYIKIILRSLFHPSLPNIWWKYYNSFQVHSLQLGNFQPVLKINAKRPWRKTCVRSTQSSSNTRGLLDYVRKNRVLHVLCFRASPVKPGYYAQNDARLEV